MVTVRLKGGLGNQMFQYALGRRLADKNSCSLCLDLTQLLDTRTNPNYVKRDFDLDIFPFRAELTFLSRLASARPLPHVYYGLSVADAAVRNTFHLHEYRPERSELYDPSIVATTIPVYLDGYWQSESYFRPIGDSIRKDFALDASSSAVTAFGRCVRSVPSVCINVRRGDFVDLPTSASSLGFVGLEYYHRAVDVLSERVPNAHYFVFSDEPQWCAENILPWLSQPAMVVGHECAGRKYSDYFWLMTQCQHFIIPNSSFAWWAAWLASHSDKTVIAPRRWFRDPRKRAEDLLPKPWTTI